MDHCRVHEQHKFCGKSNDNGLYLAVFGKVPRFSLGCFG